MTTPGAASIQSRPLDENELMTLAPILDCEKIPPKTANDLHASILSYLEEKDRLATPPHTSGNDSSLNELNRRAAALHEVLSTLQEADLERMAAVASPGTNNLPQMVKNMESQLVEIAKVSEGAIEAAIAGRKEENGGLRGGEPLKKLILGLIGIYERETGKEAGNSWHPARNVYFGPFFDFVKTLVDIVEPQEALSNSSLGSQITRALMAARELSGNYLERTHGRSSRVKPTV